MKKFFAFEMNRDDNDWGTGSYTWEDAVEFLAEQHRSGNDEAIVATIEEGDDPVCVEETTYNDIF